MVSWSNSGSACDEGLVVGVADQRDGVVLNQRHRAGLGEFYDVELRRYNDAFLAAADIGPGDGVLDIGCGAGQTTRLAAVASGTGAVLGVDVSSAQLDLARRRGAEEGLTNLSFVEADAQTHAFPQAQFDVAISRFGSMFFADHISAFRNIAGALRPGARFVQLVWQRPERNEWKVEIHEALTPGRPAPTSEPTMNAFALADAGITEAMLLAAGFSEVHCVDLREPVCYGRDCVLAYAAARAQHPVRRILDTMDAEGVADALLRLRRTLAAHQRPDGVWFDARAWLVVATRASVLP